MSNLMEVNGRYGQCNTITKKKKKSYRYICLSFFSVLGLLFSNYLFKNVNY